MSKVEQIFNLLVSGRSVFLSGPGGTGKSHTIRELFKKINSETQKKIAITASTGVAALNISGGKEMPSTTLHSWAGIMLATESVEYYISLIKSKRIVLSRWKETDILIIDEISMLGYRIFEMLDLIGRDLRNTKYPFGGLTLLISGDFLQLPPVNDNWIFESPSWKDLNPTFFVFDEPKRYDDVEFFELLLRIRKARPYEEDIETLEGCVAKYDAMMKLEAIKKGPEIKPTILYSKKIDVQGYNNAKLAELPSLPVNFVAEDAFKAYTNAANFDFYASMLDDMSPKSVQLKVGAQVMLTFNVEVQTGLANGSRGVVKAIETDAVVVKFMSAGERRIERMVTTFEDLNGKAQRKQFPLILAWAMTIHKSQGTTLESAILDLGPSVFSAGGAYVALSRVKNMKGLYLSNFAISSIKASKKALAYNEDIIEKSFREEDENASKKSVRTIDNYLDKDIIQTDL